ncbi:MAG: SIR2 family protein [Candidatus Poribacteria bacterium]|nr:SIR2 family protein [Candidatus Poribacteria bacterium]
MAFEKITDEQILSLKSSLAAGKYNLLLGSGVSTDSWNEDGELLSGEELRLTLCNLQRVPKNTSLQKVYDLLNGSEIRKHITNRYSNCTPGPSVKHFPKFLWRRIFTFNIDDALESAFEENGSLQTLSSINFGDAFADSTKIEELYAIHLHGFVRQESKGYVFSRNDYINQMTSINPWMNMLAQLIRVEPFIMIGTSLDEVDLDYYMSFRNESSGRVDEGPSIFVTPKPTKVSRNECEKHNLLLFEGTCNDFMKYCNELAPNRPTPLELVGKEELRFFSGMATKRQILSFWSDFELVPGSAPKNKGISRFAYGALPSWEDLSANLDISRNATSRIISEVEKHLADPAQHPRLAIIFEKPGMGKSTILRRCAFELARRGSKVIKCSAFSQLDPNLVAELIDQVTSPLILVADDFADQVTVISDIIKSAEKKDLVILAAERSYRKGYVSEVLSGVDYINFGQLKMNFLESNHLIDAYISLGLVGARKALHEKASFSEELRKDPIAVACCRILNDFKPITRIIDSILEDCDELEKQVYIMCSLAQYCFSPNIA